MCRQHNPFAAATLAFQVQNGPSRRTNQIDPVLVVILTIRNANTRALQSSLVETNLSGKLKFLFTEKNGQIQP